MPFIEQAISDAKEAVAVPEAEYDLRIINAETQLSKKAAEKGATEDNMVHVLIAIDSPEYPNAAPIHHYLMLVTDPEEKNNALYLIGQKRFLVAFGIPYERNGFDIDDFPNATARCLVTLDENQQGEPVNQLKLPRIKEEGEAQQSRAGNGGKRGAVRPSRRH